MPQVIDRQTNEEPFATEEYFLRNVAIPFCDYITKELNTTFSEDNMARNALFSLLPIHIINVTDIGKMEKNLSIWEGDLQSPSSLRHEISVWKRKLYTVYIFY